jgi:hypothetical protein
VSQDESKLLLVVFHQGNIAFGGGTIHETGQRHRLSVPYVDENGIVQQPVFGVSSYKGKEIRRWAEKIYEQLVEESRHHHMLLMKIFKLTVIRMIPLHFLN